MPRVSAFESGRRLCLLFDSGPCRYAVAATQVTEVAPPDADGRALRGSLELRDLSMLVGGMEEERPGMAVVLDVSPTLAVRVRNVREVVDVARDPHFGLPPALARAMAFGTRGALLHAGQLFLELDPDALPQQPTSRPGPPPSPVYLCEEVPDRALVFESQGIFWGLPLPFVLQVVPRGEGFLPLPAPSGAIAGLFPHGQALWPVVSAPALIGGRAAPEPLLVMAELAGEAQALCASRVLGVHDGFHRTEGRGEYTAKGLPRPVLFLDYQRMFT